LQIAVSLASAGRCTDFSRCVVNGLFCWIVSVYGL